jgi:Uma2 family endonuclease
LRRTSRLKIWSPDDKLKVLREKIALYFQFGSRLVIVVEPQARTIAMYESADTHHAFGDGEIARCSAYPDLALDVSELLA